MADSYDDDLDFIANLAAEGPISLISLFKSDSEDECKTSRKRRLLKTTEKNARLSAIEGPIRYILLLH